MVSTPILTNPNAAIIEQIKRTVDIKGQTINLIKVKRHSNNSYNDVADQIAKNAETEARQDPSHILSIRHSNLPSSINFKLYWRNNHWDGKIRLNFTTLVALPYCADWAHSFAVSQMVRRADK